MNCSCALPLIVGIFFLGMLCSPSDSQLPTPSPFAGYPASGYPAAGAVAKSTNYTWLQLASLAAAAETRADHRASLGYANDALKLARDHASDFETGRSLILIALAMRGLGFYDLAMEFLKQAIAIGAPGGKVKIVPVWGYAAQELGAVHLQKGELDQAAKLIRETYAFAEEHQVTVGIAEGGAHLAEIALRRGDLEEAKKYAETALEAARECNCSVFNTARAMVVAARVRLVESKTNPALRATARSDIENGIRYSTQNGVKRFLAEGKILLSEALPAQEIDRKIELASSAFELLDTQEDELRGSAEAHVGSILMASGRADLADFYMKNGLKVNEELFRKLDNGYILSDIAAQQLLVGQDREAADSLRNAAQAARESESWPLAFKSEQSLADLYTTKGYYGLALKWISLALKSLAHLKELEKDQTRTTLLQQSELALRQQLFDVGVYFAARGDEADLLD